MKNSISKKQIILICVLLIVLFISVALNIYVLFFKQSKNSVSTSETTNSIPNENIIKTENNISNSTNEVSENTTNTIVVDFTDNVNTDELKQLMENYSVGIERISFDEENLESNTILLFIAKKYFDTNSNKSSLEIDTKYAATAENVHKYLTELTGHNYLNTDKIKSYSNYIGYVSNSKSYALGKDYNMISREIYTCSDLSIIDEKDDGSYSAKADITRTIDKEKTNYEVTFDFTVNKNYTYEKYCIKSLKVKNTSFYPDNTLHFVDTSVEEDENN